MTTYTGTTATPPPPRKRWQVVLAAGIALVAGVGIGAASVATTAPTVTDQASATSPPAAETVTETVTQPAAPVTETVAETAEAPAQEQAGTEAGGLMMGMYHVGVDTPAGRYTTDGPEVGDPMGCYWERTRDDSGEFESIITNGNPMGPASVTVNEGEFFNVDGSCMWFRE